jgi:hypothetical protein
MAFPMLAAAALVFLLVPLRESHGFVVVMLAKPTALTFVSSSGVVQSSSVILFQTTSSNSNHHGSAYDASSSSTVTWNPLQAAEFVLWHDDDDYSTTTARTTNNNDTHVNIGRQLQPLISHWKGTDAGEFLTRLYLGQFIIEDNSSDGDGDGETTTPSKRLTFESRNVRCCQQHWMGGLTQPHGKHALKELLHVALPDAVLEPAELARWAATFLGKEHTWPAAAAAAASAAAPMKRKPKKASVSSSTHGTNITATATSTKTTSSTSKTTTPTAATAATTKKLEKDTFASVGYTIDFAQLVSELRLERYDNSPLTVDDVLTMVVLPERKVEESGVFFLAQLDFFQHIGIQLTATEKIGIVQGMAHGGWPPATIAKFVSKIEQVPESLSVVIMTKQKANAEANANAKLLQRRQTTTEDEEERSKTQSKSAEKVNGDDNDMRLPDQVYEVPSTSYLGATHEYLSTSSSSNGATAAATAAYDEDPWQDYDERWKDLQ